MPLKHAVQINPEVLPDSTPPETVLSYVDIAALENGVAELAPTEVNFESAPSRARRVLRSGDTILSTVRTYLKAVASFPAVNTNLIASTGFAVLRPNGQLSPRFAYWAALAEPFIENVVANSDGVSYPAINPTLLGTLPLAVPPPNDQHRIANFLDDKTARIDALIAEKEGLIGKLLEYLYSHASALMTQGASAGVKLQKTSFPELGSIPTHWEVKRLKFLGEVRSGVAKGKDIGEKSTVALPYLRVANVQDGYVDLTEVHSIEVAEAEAQRYLLRVGDVLMNEGGDNDKLGRGTVWQGQIHPCIHQNHVFAVRLNDLDLAEWVARFTSTDAARSYFFLRSKQSTNLASINQSNVRELPVPMPPAAERCALLKQVRSATSRVQELVQHAQEHIERLREYRSSLISAAVTGELALDDRKTKGEQRLPS